MAERGLRVAVVEREPIPGAGSTGRSAAGVRHQFSDPVNVELSRDSIVEYRRMPEAGYRPIGYLFYVPEAMWAAQMRAVEMQRALGADVEILDTRSAARIVPARFDGLRGATFCRDDGVVDPHGICMAWFRQARALGVRFAFGQEVVAIEHDGACWRVRTAPAGGLATAGAPAGERAVADARTTLLVNAAGAWGGAVARLAGLQVPVWPARRMVFVTGALHASLRLAHPYPLTVDLATGVWFRSEGERLIFGLANPDDTGFAEGVDWPWLENTYEAALAHFPWFERLDVDRRACWWGYYEETPDHNPILGRMPGATGWINACGFSGHGVQQAGATGRLIAQEALGERTAIDIAPLRIERFDRARDEPDAGERLVV